MTGGEASCAVCYFFLSVLAFFIDFQSKQAMGDESFNFKDWAKALPKDVARTLVEEGFDSFMALTNCSREDIETLPLKRGHMVATTAHVRQLQASCGEGPLVESVPSRNQAVLGVGLNQGQSTPLDELLASTPGLRSVGVEGGGGAAPLRADLEPTIYLRTNTSQGDVLKIIDFVSVCEPSEKEHKLGEGVSILLPRSKPRLDSITPAQWIAANSRIMAALVQRGQLSGQGVLDYLAYTTKVGEMATRYTWPSVLQYDDQYRSSQASFHFRWGSDCQHLALVALRERPQQQQHGNRAPGATSRHHSHAAPSEGEACLLWNRGNCSYRRCKFVHCCSTCGKPDHTALAHTRPSAPESAR